MEKKMRFVIFVLISFSLLACSLGNIIAKTREATPTVTATRTAQIPKTNTSLPSPSPTQSPAAPNLLNLLKFVRWSIKPISKPF